MHVVKRIWYEKQEKGAYALYSRMTVLCPKLYPSTGSPTKHAEGQGSASGYGEQHAERVTQRCWQRWQAARMEGKDVDSRRRTR